MSTPHVQLHFPPGQQYSCTECGKCCRVPWRIRLFQDEVDRIKTFESYKRLEREGFQPLVVVDEKFQINRKSNARCYFLADDGLCDIHREQGVAAKPSVCQLYPFNLVRTPQGYFVSMAFTCPAVISGAGGAANAHAEELANTVVAAPAFFPPDYEPSPSVRLSKNRTIAWSDYVQFEQQLYQAVSLAPTSTQALLFAVAGCVAYATGKEEHLFLDGNSGLLHAVAEQLESMLPAFSSCLVASLEEDSDPTRRAERLTEIQEGRFYSKWIEGEVEFDRRVEVDVLLKNVLDRYVLNKIWGKLLIVGPNLVVRMLTLALSLEIFLLYYGAKAKKDGIRHFSVELAEWCFDLVEAELLVHDELYLEFVEEWENYCLELVSAL